MKLPSTLRLLKIRKQPSWYRASQGVGLTKKLQPSPFGTVASTSSLYDKDNLYGCLQHAIFGHGPESAKSTESLSGRVVGIRLQTAIHSFFQSSAIHSLASISFSQGIVLSMIRDTGKLR